MRWEKRAQLKWRSNATQQHQQHHHHNNKKLTITLGINGNMLTVIAYTIDKRFKCKQKKTTNERKKNLPATTMEKPIELYNGQFKFVDARFFFLFLSLFHFLLFVYKVDAYEMGHCFSVTSCMLFFSSSLALLLILYALYRVVCCLSQITSSKS